MFKKLYILTKKNSIIILLLFIFPVYAPSKLTTFKCLPRWIIIFNSEAKALMYEGSVFGLTILTATVVVVSLSIIPIASALKTTPNAPEPSCLPKNEIKNY